MSNPTDPNFEQQPGSQVPAPQAPSAPEAPSYQAAPPAPPVPPAPPAPPAAQPYAAQQPYSAQQPPAAPQYGAPQYGAPQYAAQQQYAPAKPTNTMAIISMVSSIVGWFTFGLLCLLGVILGHISLKQIKERGEGGRGMAIAGLIIGYIGIAGWVIGLILFFIFMSMVGVALSDPSFLTELEQLG